MILPCICAFASSQRMHGETSGRSFVSENIVHSFSKNLIQSGHLCKDALNLQCQIGGPTIFCSDCQNDCHSEWSVVAYADRMNLWVRDVYLNWFTCQKVIWTVVVVWWREGLLFSCAVDKNPKHRRGQITHVLFDFITIYICSPYFFIVCRYVD